MARYLLTMWSCAVIFSPCISNRSRTGIRRPPSCCARAFATAPRSKNAPLPICRIGRLNSSRGCARCSRAAPRRRPPAPRLIGFRPLSVFAMELFTKLFGNLLAFVYHCFDRIVIHGYLSALSRPEQVVYFFRQVLGVPVVSKEILSQRTADYQSWVEAFARNHHTPIVWAEKGVRKEDHVLAWQRRMAKNNAYGVYFIFKSMEQGPTFRISMPKYPAKDPHYRILAHQRSRFTHYYFYIRDEVLGPMVMRVASFFPFQTTYYLNGHSFIEQELNRAQ